MANEPLTLPERAALLALMIIVEEASNPELNEQFGFPIKRAVRERLTELGYITHHLRHRAIAHELTDAGWRRCREELTEHAPPRADRGYRLMYGLFSHLDDYLRRHTLAIADIFTVESETPEQPDPEQQDRSKKQAVEERIRAGYQELVAEPGGWVNLNRIRAALLDVPRDNVDAALLSLDLQPKVYLIPEVNQKTLTDAERVAAIRIGGEDKHLLSIECA